MAQTAPPAEDADAGADSAVITVTASRIAKAGFEAPTPTTIISTEALEASPQPNIAANLNQLPALSGSVSPRTAGNGAGGGTQGANFLNLRSLGANRTLVLLDRRRVVASATTGSIDLSLLPTPLIKQVDVVTGGGSAAWGSDAVAGVVNLVLDTKYTGLKGSAQTGISTYGDGREFRADLAGGFSFAEGRGHFVASGSYSKSASIDRVDSRPWFVGTKLFNNPAFVAGNGQPKLIVADHVNAATGTLGGLITAGPLRGTQFLAGGVPAPFTFGTVGSNVSLVNGAYGGSQLAIGGTPNDLSVYDQMLADGQQYSVFARGSYDLSEAITLYGEFIYGRSQVDSLSVPYLTMAPNGGPITIKRSNAYLPAATAAAMDLAGLTTIQVNRYNLDLGFAAPHNDRKLYRYMVGADVDLGNSWKARVYYEHGLSKVLNEIRNDAIVSNFAFAVDSIKDPNGQIVCNPANSPAAGCIPFNVFGPQTPTDAQRAYLLGTARQNITLKEDVVSLDVNGDLFSLPAGTVSLAAGAEYRRENHVATADPNSLLNTTGKAPGTGNWWVGNYKPSSGGYNVKEAFAEILVPIFKDSPLGRSFDFNGAARMTDYSTSGTVKTWKAGATYDIAGGFKLRGVLSRDIRAPNLNEYFLGGTANSISVVDGANGAVSALRIQSGNAKLKPEIAKTLTIGAVFQPEFLPGFSISADYFHIKINGAIGTLTPQQTVDRCLAGNAALCAFLIRDPAGKLTTVLAQPVNFRTQVMSGVDFEGGYRFSLGHGTMSIRSLWTYTSHHYLDDNGVKDVLLGEVPQFPNGGPVKLRGFNSVAYDSERFNVSLRHRFIGKAVLDAAWTAADIDNASIPSVNYFDISATAKVASGDTKFEVFGSIDNLLNKAPPRAPQTGGNPNTNIGTAPAFYDLVGRYFRFGVRFKM